MTDFGSVIKGLLANIIEFATTAGIRLIGAVLIVVIGIILTSKLSKLLKKRMSTKLEKSVCDFVSSFVSIALNAVIILTAANYLGVPMTNLVAIVGSCGLAVGLALQGSLSNLAGGIMILIFKPFKDGDFVSINGLDGTVKEITILYTYLTTPDKKTIIIPNSTASNASVTNFSMEQYRRVDVPVGVSYKSDVNEVRRVLLDFVKDVEFVEKDPAPVVVISAYADSSINFTIRVWTENAHYWDVMGSINYGLQKVLADNGIEVPYPQLDVHLDK